MGSDHAGLHHQFLEGIDRSGLVTNVYGLPTSVRTLLEI